MAPCLPPARGRLTRALFEHWLDRRPLRPPALDGIDALLDDDLHLALWCCYEQHHHGFEGLSDRWEWDLETLAFRAALEDAYEQALRAEHDPGALPADPVAAVQEITTWAGPPLSRRIADAGTRAELTEFAKETHDFESRYLDSLIGALPKAEELYVSRAPLNHVDTLATPVLLLQGLDDPVVPPAQAERFIDGLRSKGVPYAFRFYEGESHGFRRMETKVDSLERELGFYGAVLGFTPPGVPEVELLGG